MSLKNPVTPPGIDPGIVRLVAQRLNHYAAPGPIHSTYGIYYTNKVYQRIFKPLRSDDTCNKTGVPPCEVPLVVRVPTNQAAVRT
jgi:hypothetical protein